MEQIGFMIACRRYFGMKPGEKLLEFASEVKVLSEKDKADLLPLLQAEMVDVKITE